jgi:hypothetical protein
MSDPVSNIGNSKASFRKHPGFSVNDGLCFECPPRTTRPTMISVSHQDGSVTSVPPWVAFDHQVLRFKAISEEIVPESRSERIRKKCFTLLYYLEDGTISIVADKSNADGIPGGVVLNRCKVEAISIESLRAGQCVVIFGYVYQIVSADKFTADFYESIGIKQAQVEDFSKMSSTTSSRPKKSPAVLEEGRSQQTRRTMQCLTNDRKVCRFYANLSCTNEPRAFMILFYLSDNTVEIREVFGKNSGRDEASVWFRRGRLLSDGSPFKGDGSPFDVKCMDVGRMVRLLFNDFQITGCDVFTRSWFTDVYGITLSNDIEVPVLQSEGSQEEPDDVRRPNSSDNVILRCLCRKLNGTPEDSERRFVLSYNSGTREIAMFEPPIRNSGIIGGRFLEKGVYEDCTLDISIFKVGEEFQVLSHRFKIEEVDRGTSVYLENLQVQTNYPKECRKEALKMIPNTQLIRALVETRPGFDLRLMKELGTLSRNAAVTSPEILQKALENLGHKHKIEEILACLKAGTVEINIFEFIRSLKRSR